MWGLVWLGFFRLHLFCAFFLLVINLFCALVRFSLKLGFLLGGLFEMLNSWVHTSTSLLAHPLYWVVSVSCATKKGFEMADDINEMLKRLNFFEEESAQVISINIENNY